MAKDVMEFLPPSEINRGLGDEDMVDEKDLLYVIACELQIANRLKAIEILFKNGDLSTPHYEQLQKIAER